MLEQLQQSSSGKSAKESWEEKKHTALKMNQRECIDGILWNGSHDNWTWQQYPVGNFELCNSKARES